MLTTQWKPKDCGHANLQRWAYHMGLLSPWRYLTTRRSELSRTFRRMAGKGDKNWSSGPPKKKGPAGHSWLWVMLEYGTEPNFKSQAPSGSRWSRILSAPTHLPETMINPFWRKINSALPHLFSTHNVNTQTTTSQATEEGRQHHESQSRPGNWVIRQTS